MNLTNNWSTNGWTLLTWNQFVPVFGTWLLPWLALTAQLPFETRDSATNIMSWCLMLGSPMLAGYTLALIVLNVRWITREFRYLREEVKGLSPKLDSQQIEALEGISWILCEIQHAPLRVDFGSNHELAQVIVRPENAAAWIQLRHELGRTKRRKTRSLFAQLAWVIATQLLSIIQLFTTGADDNSVELGLAINSLWTWMLPLV